MGKLIAVTPDGTAREIDYSSGPTAMEVIRDAGVEELAALCGGVLSCATCHVHVEPAFLDRLPVMSEDEDALLEGASHRDACSRLSCQIRLTEELSGMRLKVAETD
jgi:2Fe-2S ferredoxin